MKNKMTDEELNIAIHKWLDKGCWHNDVEIAANQFTVKRRCGKCKVEVPLDVSFNPDYCQDRNSVQEFLDYMESHEMEWWEMVWALYGASESSLFTFPEAVKLAVKLSPRQLAEAGAKAVGIYEEE